MKLIKNKFIKFIIFLLFFISCNKTGGIDQSYIDPHIVFTSRRWWNYDIFISDIFNSSMTQLTKNKWIDFNPTISKDGSKLAFISDRDGNREIYITDLIWMDGYTQWQGQNLTNITVSSQNDWTPRFSPVEDKIIFTTYFPDNDNYDVFIMNSDGSNKINLTNTKFYEKYPQFSPDGSFIIYQAWQKGKMEIFFLNILEKNKINLTRNVLSHDIISHGNAFSPDGQKIVFTSERDGNREIYIMNSNGSNQIRLTENPSHDYEPIFSPDGQKIVFTSERDGNREIYIMDINGGGLSNLSNNAGDDWNPRYFHDGNKIVFQSTRDGNWEIYLMKLDGKGQRNLSNHSSTDYSYVVLPLNNSSH